MQMTLAMTPWPAVMATHPSSRHVATGRGQMEEVEEEEEKEEGEE